MGTGYSGDGNTIVHVEEWVSTSWGCTVIQGRGRACLSGLLERVIVFVCKDKPTEGKITEDMDMVREDR